MAKKGTIIAIIVILIVGGLGGTGGIFYYGATNLEVTIDELTLTSFELGGTILDPRTSVELEIDGTVTSPTGIPLSIRGATYELVIDGIDFGSGTIAAFSASKTPTPLDIYLNAEDLPASVYPLLLSYVGGENLTAVVTITGIDLIGFMIPVNITIEETI